MTLLDGSVLCAAAAAAGAVNAVAGGGTLISFPALLGAGVEGRMANATSTFALWPGAGAAAAGYRDELGGTGPIFRKLIPVSLVGGGLGAWLLSATSRDDFARAVPVLVLFATLLFAFSERLAGWFRKEAQGERTPGVLAVAFQFGIAVYGGFFGAGIGILMLGALAFLHMDNIHRMNGVKITLGMLINTVAVAVFVAQGLVSWPEALVMAVGAAAGGFGGARLARRLPKRGIRAFVIVVGLGTAAWRGWVVWG